MNLQKAAAKSSKLIEDDEEYGIMRGSSRASKKEVKADDNVESSGTGSDNNVESSDTGSSGGKRSTGYSADGSASDQSSDDTTQKEGTRRLSLNRFHLNDMSSETASSQQSSSAEDDDGGASSEEKSQPAVNSRDGLLTALKRALVSRKAAGRPTASVGKKSKARQKHRSNYTYRRAPRHSPDNLEHISNMYTANRHMTHASLYERNQILPQWNGVKIANPMDPRIDLSTVEQVQAPVPSSFLHPTHASSNGDVPYGVPLSCEALDPPSLEAYMQLLSVSIFCESTDCPF
jgi:hypothetical protein